MVKDVDARKKRKALRKIRKAAALAEQGLGPPLSEWEATFLEEVETRIETYGSAFHDSEKGGADEALSALQQIKLREIDRKARGKSPSGFGRKGFKSKQKASEPEAEDQRPPEPNKAKLTALRPVPSATSAAPEDSPRKRPAPKLRLIQGGTE